MGRLATNGGVAKMRMHKPETYLSLYCVGMVYETGVTGSYVSVCVYTVY